MTDTAGVRMHAVHKTFGTREVLTGVDLQVPTGSITAVLGPSGCGKTTLLRILAGFTEPDAGEVHIAGELMAGRARAVPAHRRRVGLMPQEGALFPHLSIGQNIAFGLGRMSRTEAREAVTRWLTVVGLDGLADARPHQLSGGQQQRVALARALAARPQVLLLDEPFAALDAALRVRVREDIAEILRNTNTTALLVTHDQAEALSLADDVALLMDGSVAQHGPPSELYERPTTLAAARFIGATVELDGESRAGHIHSALGVTTARLPVADGPVTVVLRPEQLHIAELPGGVPATVTAQRFYGPDTIVHVVLGDGTSLQVRSVTGHPEHFGENVTLTVVGDVLAYRP